MRTIGYIGGAMKPIHAGHWKLITTAAHECDEVLLFISTSDRERVTHLMMKHIWDVYLQQYLPHNVKLNFCKNPVRAIFEAVGNIDKLKTSNTKCVIYTDIEDANERYSDNSLKKYFSNLWTKSNIIVKSFERTTFADYSSTAMRHALEIGDKVLFVAMLPECINGKEESERLWNDISHKKQSELGFKTKA
jgi:cytidyltransferase-like protein